MDAYINLLKAEKHLLCRDEGSTIYLETTLGTGILHRDGQNCQKDITSRRDDEIVDRVTQYINHDLVITKLISYNQISYVLEF